MENSDHHDSSDTENENQAAWTGLLDPLVNAAPLRAAIPGAAVNESPSDAHVRIGLVNRTKEFPSRAEAKTFIRKNMFAGSKGEPCAEFALHYERFTCSQCDFHCRVHFEDPAIADTLKTGKCLLEVPTNAHQWHKHGCERLVRGIARGGWGVSSELRDECKSAKRAKTLVGEWARRVQPTEGGRLPTKRQISNMRSYDARKKNKEYATSPLEFLMRSDENTVVKTHFTTGASFTLLSRQDLVRECAKGDVLIVDSTYWSAPKNCWMANLGFTRYGSFVPVCVVIVTHPPDGNTSTKVHERAEEWTEVMKGFKEVLVEANVPGWEPRYVVRDHAGAIRLGVACVFPRAVQFVCYFHVQQAVKTWTKDNALDADTSRAMHDFMERLHFTDDIISFQTGWVIGERDFNTPAWNAFFHWNENAGRAEGGVNGVWSRCWLDCGDTATNCGVERYHRSLRSALKAHESLRCVATEVTGILAQTAATFMRVEGGELPIYFERREEDRVNEFTTMRERSREYLHALHGSAPGCVARGCALFLRRGKAVVCITRREYETLKQRRGESWARFEECSEVRKATAVECNCPAFLKSAWGFCKHTMAMKEFESLIVTPPRPPAAPVVPPALAVIDINRRVTRSSRSTPTPNGVPVGTLVHQFQQVKSSLE